MNQQFQKHLSFKCLALIAGLSAMVCSAGESGPRRVLVVGRPIAAKQVMPAAKDAEPSEIPIVANTYVVKVRVMQQIPAVDRAVPRTIPVDVVTRDIKFVMANDVHLLIEVGGDKPRVIHWGFITRLACIPTHLLDRESLELEYFPSPFDGGEGENCRKLPGPRSE